MESPILSKVDSLLIVRDPYDQRDKSVEDSVFNDSFEREPLTDESLIIENLKHLAQD